MKRIRPVSLRRQGAVTIEMAFVVPVVLLVFFGLWEWSRVEMVKHVCENAVFAGARVGTLPGATNAKTEAHVLAILDAYMIKGGTADATFNLGTGESSVSVSVPITGNSTLAGAMFNDKYINSQMTLVQ